MMDNENLNVCNWKMVIRRPLRRVTDVPAFGLGLVVLLAVLAGCRPETEVNSETGGGSVFDVPVDYELVVEAVPNAIAYATVRIEAPAGSTVRLVIDNRETTAAAMHHNVVVLRDSSAVDRVGRAAAGERDHIPDDPAILVYTPMATPRERTAVVFTMPPPGEYLYICTYPGHYQLMQGTLVSTTNP